MRGLFPVTTPDLSVTFIVLFTYPTHIIRVNTTSVTFIGNCWPGKTNHMQHFRTNKYVVSRFKNSIHIS